MDNFIENKKIALFVVNLVSKIYHLDDAVLVEFHPASRFPNPEVTAMVTRDYRILYNIDRLKVAPDYELYITSFHEMRHIYQYCCIDFGHKLAFKKYFKEILQMKIITSEAVFKGHPDKICDQISDAILDECLKQDNKSRVAIETLIKNDLVVIAGELTTNAKINYKDIVVKVLSDLGYENLANLKVQVEVSKQSNDIALGVDKDGAGDQGIMYGYATDETKELMPLPIVLARRIAIKMDEITRPLREMFGADGKCQVSVAYDDYGNPLKVTTIVVSQQTAYKLDREFYTKRSFTMFDKIRQIINVAFKTFKHYKS